MRHFFLFFCLLLCSFLAFGQTSKHTNQSPRINQPSSSAEHQSPQAFYYYFTYDRQTYVPLSSGNDLSSGLSWDKPQMKIPLPYAFRFFDFLTDTLYLNAHAKGELLGISGKQKGKGPLLLLYSANLLDRSMDSLPPGMAGGESPILVNTLGLPGNRITILEIRNAGLKNDLLLDGVSEDYVNFQVHFLEKTSSIELHMGPSRITWPQLIFNGESGSAMGMITEFDFVNNQILGPGLWLYGSPRIPGTVIDMNFNHLEDSVPSGMVYRFIRNDISTTVKAELESAPKLYPNPASDWLNVEMPLGKMGELRWRNIHGQLMLRQKLHSGSRLDVSQLEAGTYLLEILVEGQPPAYQKMLIQ